MNILNYFLIITIALFEIDSTTLSTYESETFEIQTLQTFQKYIMYTHLSRKYVSYANPRQ